MLKIGDTVKVIGKALTEKGTKKELIPIGTICCVIEMDDSKNELVVCVSPKGVIPHKKVWYLEHDVEKGNMKWIKYM